jgi:hypothetical protein
MEITPSGQTLGASITGIDLGQKLSDLTSAQSCARSAHMACCAFRCKR